MLLPGSHYMEFLDISSFGLTDWLTCNTKLPASLSPPSSYSLSLSHCLPLPAVNFYVVAVSAAAAVAASARWTRLPKCFVLFCFGGRERAKYFCYHCNLSRNVGAAVLFARVASSRGVRVVVRTCC